jgi:hypothetical protein
MANSSGVGEGDVSNWSLISRSLSNHNAYAAYLLLAEEYPLPIACHALIKLIDTVPNWPQASQRELSVILAKLLIDRCSCCDLRIADCENCEVNDEIISILIKKSEEVRDG